MTMTMTNDHQLYSYKRHQGKQMEQITANNILWEVFLFPWSKTLLLYPVTCGLVGSPNNEISWHHSTTEIQPMAQAVETLHSLRQQQPGPGGILLVPDKLSKEK